MADYFSQTVIQPTIPVADITPLERLLLSHIFNAERDGEGLYFYADEGPADMIWLDRAPIEAALAQSPPAVDNTATTFVTGKLARVPADNVEIELDFSDMGWEAIFQDIVRRSTSLRYVTAVSAFTCSTHAPRRLWRHGGRDHCIRRHRQVHQLTSSGLPQRGRARLGGRTRQGLSATIHPHNAERSHRVRGGPEAGEPRTVKERAPSGFANPSLPETFLHAHLRIRRTRGGHTPACSCRRPRPTRRRA